MAQRSKTVVGLDIDPTGITAAQVGSGGRMSVERCASMALEPGIVRDGEILDVDALSDALKALYRENKSLDRRVRVGLANQKIVVRTIEMPLIKDRKELAAAVRFQAADELPMPLDQAVLDWQPLEVFEVDGNKRQRILLVAARRDMIDRVVAAVRGAGLRLEGIDLGAFGMIRALAPPGAEGDDADNAVLYVAAAGLTNLAVARGTQCLFTRAAGGGAEAIAVDLAERRALTLEHARDWLTYVGLQSDPATLEGDAEIIADARRALEDGVRRVATDIRQSLDFHHMQSGGSTVSRAVLTGRAAEINGFAEALSAELGMPVSRGEVPGTPPEDAATYSVAAGLSVPGTPDINLLPAEERKAAGGGGRSGGVVYAVLGALALAVVFASLSTMVGNDITSKNQQLTVISQQADTAEGEATRLSAYSDFSALRQRRIDTITQLTGNRTDWAHNLGELARTLPRNVWLTSVDGENGAPPVEGAALTADAAGATLTITGCTTGHRSVASVMSAMRRIDGIQKVTLTSTEKPGGGGGGGGGSGAGGGDCRGTHDGFVLFSMKLTFKQPVIAPAGATGAQGAIQPAAATGAQAGATTPTSSGSVQ
jgi:type IV pilus assembly protein PilM